ncbi:MAG: sulfur reduction protein DsrE [Frankiales bacterium]|nr:sulfur reduction protein DsrE [Frankiales bacterium]
MRRLVVKLTAGADAPERCLQGLTVASVALAAGADVSLWLTGESVRLAVPGGELELPESPPASVLLAAVLAGGTVQVCTQCAARRGLTEADLTAGITIAGAAAFVEQVLGDGVQALVY